MFAAIFSFLGGAAGRALIGQAIDWLKAKQEHQQEMERLRLQGELDAAVHARQQESIRLQAQLNVQQVQVQGDADVAKLEAQAFTEAMKSANVQTGVRWIDGWNGSIRPSAATVAVLLWLLKVIKAGLVLTAWDENLVASVLGYYFADRHIAKGK
jgi:hypothetical protein